ncbi:MAG: YCF48-related protein [Ignavibacteria bacterium]
MKVLYYLKSSKSTILSFQILLLLFAVSSYSQSGWFSQPLPVSGQVQDLKFFDANTGLIAMWQPTVLLRTTNGGYNWDSVLNIQVAWQFDLIDSNIVYAIGSGVTVESNGILLKSINRGATWDSLPVANSWTVNGISFVNRDTGWVGGTAGGLPFLWRTTNAGITWTVQSSNTGFGKVFFLKNKVNGEYVGWSQNYGTLWITTNSGINWIQNTSVGELPDAIAMFFSDQFTGYISNNTKLTKTTDGGDSWHNYEMPSGNLISARWFQKFDVLNKDTIYGEGGDRYFGGGKVRRIIWVSTNGGVNWGFQQPDTSIAKFFIGIDFVNKDTGWSSWIRTNDGGGPIIITGINNQITTKPELFILEQNYPNPFNSSTRINFSISKPSFISLTIYDIIGMEVLKIYNNEFFTAGNYYAGIDIGKMGLSSGVYIYRMRALDIKSNNVFEQSRKFVYVK